MVNMLKGLKASFFEGILMDFDKIEKFIELAKEKGVKELKVENKDMKLSVTMPFSESTSSAVLPTLSSNLQENSDASSASKKLPTKNSNDREITSPFVGTFYRSSSPADDPYVKVGQKVNKGDVVCIVEAMKIMNEIESEFAGTIEEICVENENYVEFGQVLFRIKPV